MSNQRFLLEFCLSGELDIHPDDIKTYKRYMFARTQYRADVLSKKINLSHEIEFLSYINSGLDKADRLRMLREKFRGESC